MKRVIVDFKKLTEDILNMLVEKFPDGYNDSDIVIFNNAAGEKVEAVEVKTEDTVYLVKISFRLEQSMENHMDTSVDDEDNDLDLINDDDPIREEEEMDFEDQDDEDVDNEDETLDEV